MISDNERYVAPVYWRGQSNPLHALASSFERIILKMAGGSSEGPASVYPYGGRYERGGKRIWEPGYYQTVRDGYLRAFKQAASGLRGPAPPNLDQDQWWALGRHYGLVTPLLDWTELPYVAAFFALAELRTKRIWLEREAVAVYQLIHDRLEGDGLRVVRPLVDELGRMQGQRGLFTWLDSEQFFELQGFLDNTGNGDLLTQVLISEQAVIDGWRDLRAHGIDYRLLFPDLSGAARHANSLSLR